MSIKSREDDMTKASAPDGSECEIRAVVFKEGDFYVAQCIEYDIATQALELDQVLSRLELTLEAEFEACVQSGKEPKDCISPAPNYYHGLWEKSCFAIQRIGVETPAFPNLHIAIAKAA